MALQPNQTVRIPTGMHSLPVELLLHIVDYLEVQDKFALEHTCHIFYLLCEPYVTDVAPLVRRLNNTPLDFDRRGKDFINRLAWTPGARFFVRRLIVDYDPVATEGDNASVSVTGGTISASRYAFKHSRERIHEHLLPFGMSFNYTSKDRPLIMLTILLNLRVLEFPLTWLEGVPADFPHRMTICHDVFEKTQFLSKLTKPTIHVPRTGRARVRDFRTLLYFLPSQQ